MRKINLFIFLLVASILSFSGCSKKRPLPSIIQGQPTGTVMVNGWSKKVKAEKDERNFLD